MKSKDYKNKIVAAIKALSALKCHKEFNGRPYYVNHLLKQLYTHKADITIEELQEKKEN